MVSHAVITVTDVVNLDTSPAIAQILKPRVSLVVEVETASAAESSVTLPETAQAPRCLTTDPALLALETASSAAS